MSLPCPPDLNQLETFLSLADGKNRGPFNETINYNENFDWRWEQGRLGFGIFGRLDSSC